jgi:hypothetical protein
MNGDLILYKKMYDFLVWYFNKTDSFPKSKRFSIGQRLENLLLNYFIKEKLGIKYYICYVDDFEFILLAPGFNPGR